MGRALTAFIDDNALKHNLACVRKATNNKSVLAMIKANGYGHGLIKVAKSLASAEGFGVACIEEALSLREAGIQNRIVLMQGFFNAKDELPEILAQKLDIVLHHPSQIEALKTHQTPSRIWLKINTGMHRLGFSEKDFKIAMETLKDMPWVVIEGFLSHFSKADELDKQDTLQQMHAFSKITQHLKGAKSLANSAAILGWPESHADWVRPGIMLYGVSPFDNRTGVDEGLKPVMTLRSEIISIQDLHKNDAVGYGGIFIAPQDMRIGVVAVGYGDGYPRLAPQGTPVFVHGTITPLIGRVSMDMITIDLSQVPEVKIGDTVELWGPRLPVEVVAKAIGTIGYELLTSLSPRVSFV